MLKVYYVGMSVVVLHGKNLEIKLGLFVFLFLLNLHSNHLQMKKKMLPLFKRGTIYLRDWLTNLETIIL